MTTYYVSGPMTGRPEFNFPAFDSLSEWLIDHGDRPISPADHDRRVGEAMGVGAPETLDGYAEGDIHRYHEAMGASFENLLGWDLVQIAGPDCDAIVMLPGWEQSTGAKHERYVAEACRKPVWLAIKGNHGYGDWYLVLDSTQRRLTEEHPVNRRVEGEDIEALEAQARSFAKLADTQARRIAACLDPITGEPDVAGLYTDARLTVQPIDPRNVDGTTIQTSETGGQKGAKSVELGRLPQAALRGVAEHFHQGSQKYPDVAPGVANWSLGYDWSLSLEALKRHLSLWESGEDNDPEFGTSHLRAVGFHALVLAEFEIQGWGTDDRRTPEARNKHVTWSSFKPNGPPLHKRPADFAPIREAQA